MAAEIITPQLGESVSEATVAKWFKKQGEFVNKDDLLVELETDKVTLEVNAISAGVLKEIKVKEGDTVSVGALLGIIDESAKGAAPANANAPKPAAAPAPAPAAAKPAASAPAATTLGEIARSGPAARKLAEETGVSTSGIAGSGKDGRITKGDIINAQSGGSEVASGPREERVKMTKLRQVIARRLKESQNTAAILTTFNEVDMTNVFALRNEYKDAFEKKHGTKLGFMSFFVKAAVNALKEIPAVNAEIDGDEIVYKHFYDIGVAVGTPQGLVVPVVRDADRKSYAEIEKDIANYGKKARDGKLTMQELTGGTFTVSNGGVYGSLMSTPIVNPPQSAILGMHKTQERPMVVNGKIEIRPMMYLALSYDHRIIDGKEAVTFLVRIKDAIEDPRRLLLDM
ncbi:MAG: 2-oxoglutarate dehydrogenase complex dihydrolipoyllysine-residue succinyltransferase [Proteobacteria bacterium]|nr:2-oxoglutarate dehydrogenase complex dihydrolipoyllysine-residue succinyltransferase [Pseudomonadota bacterium]